MVDLICRRASWPSRLHSNLVIVCVQDDKLVATAEPDNVVHRYHGDNGFVADLQVDHLGFPLGQLRVAVQVAIGLGNKYVRVIISYNCGRVTQLEPIREPEGGCVISVDACFCHADPHLAIHREDGRSPFLELQRPLNGQVVRIQDEHLRPIHGLPLAKMAVLPVHPDLAHGRHEAAVPDGDAVAEDLRGDVAVEGGHREPVDEAAC